MAITVERMVAVLEARLDQFDKAVAKSRAQAVGDFQAITAAGDKMEAAIGRFGASGKKGADAVAKSMASLKGQTSNLAAQFNDIGVQLAGGQSPFLIALQQGTQISQVLGQGGARGAVSALGGAFLSLLNPISLGTIAAIALGGTVIQYFTSLISEGEKSEETLKAQAQLIDAVATKWGEAYPAIKAYNDELKRTKDQADLLAAIDIVKAEQLKNVPDLLDQLNIEMADFISQLRLAGEEDEQIINLQNAINGAAEKMREGGDASGELNSAMGILKSGIENQANPAVQSMIDLLGSLSQASQQTALAVASVVNSAAKVQEQIQNTIQAASFKDNNGNIRQPSEFIPGAAPTPDSRPLIELEGLPGAGGRKSGTKTDPYKSATQSIVDRTAALEAQRAAQASINPLVNDYGYALEQAKARQELMTAAQKAGKEITPQLAAEIDKVANAYAATSAELQKLAEEHRKAAEALQFQKDLVNGALSDMRSALEDGKLTWEDLGNVAVNVLNKIADRIQTMLVDQLFSSGGFNLLGLLGGSSTAAFNPAGKVGLFAAGGYTGAGGKNKPAGIVHGGEYVFSKDAVQRAGVANLEAMHRALKGYASGGFVGSMPRIAGVRSPDPVPVDVSVRTFVDQDGNWHSAVERISTGAAIKTARGYRDKSMSNDVQKALSRPRVRGRLP